MRESKFPLSKTEIRTFEDHQLFVQYREWSEWKEQVNKWRDERIELYKDRKDSRPSIKEHWERQLRWADLALRCIDADMKRRGAVPFCLRLPGESKQVTEKRARAITVGQRREALPLVRRRLSQLPKSAYLGQ